MNAITCPDCKSPMPLKPGRHGFFFGCSAYPACCSTHPADEYGRPIGEPVDREHRTLRSRTLDLLNTLWRAKDDTISKNLRRRWRTIAYLMLAVKMPWNKPGQECFINHFDKAECRRAIEILTSTSTMQMLQWYRRWQKETAKIHGRRGVRPAAERAKGKSVFIRHY